jgi:hypothetical protein
MFLEPLLPGQPYKGFYLRAQGEISLISVGKEGNRRRTRGRQRIAGLSADQKPISARQFAACPEFCVCRSRLRRCSGTPRPDGRVAGIRMAYVRRWALLPGAGVDARRSAGLERTFRLAALAFPMAYDARKRRFRNHNSPFQEIGPRSILLFLPLVQNRSQIGIDPHCPPVSLPAALPSSRAVSGALAAVLPHPIPAGSRFLSALVCELVPSRADAAIVCLVVRELPGVVFACSFPAG